MKKEELDTLIINKRGSGKESKEIFKEINDLKQSQMIFKENKKEIIDLNKVIDKLENKNAKLTNKLFKLGLQAHPKREDKDRRVATINDLNRVNKTMKFTKHSLTQTEIRELCLMTNEKARACINCLMKFNKVKLINNGNSKKYQYI